MSEDEACPNRISRDYALMRMENIVASDLIGYTDTDIKEIAEQFHCAQCKLLVSIDSSNRQIEHEVTEQFDLLVKSALTRVRFEGRKHEPKVEHINASRLPKIAIKPFDGDIGNWQSFIQLYNSLIHCKDIPNVEKLHYLVSLVQGKAHSLIENFPMTNESYIDAYNTLVSNFDKERLIAMTYYERMLNCEPVHKKTASELELVFRTFQDNLSALEKYGLPDRNFMLFYLLWSKLDENTREQFQLTLDEGEQHRVPKFENVLKFVEKHFQALENAGSRSSLLTATSNHKTKQVNRPLSGESKFKRGKSFVAHSAASCPLCKATGHNLESCREFLKREPKQRFEFVKSNSLCVLCFSSSHRVKSCKSMLSRCEKCKQNHHTLLHFGEPSSGAVDPPSNTETDNPVKNKDTVLTSVANKDSSFVLFSTARVLIKDSGGRFKPIRILLDCASTCNFISEPCAKSLGLDIRKGHHSVSGIGNSTAKPLGSLSCEITTSHDRDSCRSISLEALVLPSICTDLPVHPVDSSGWSHIKQLVLADPEFARPGPVDMLVNADVFASSLLSGLRRGKPGQPCAIRTIFGWILMGGCDIGHTNNSRCLFVSDSSDSSLDTTLKRFWEVENVQPSAPSLSKEDERAEQIFSKHTRTEEGRYVVPLPFVSETRPIFSKSREIALKRFSCLERKLNINPLFRQSYTAFMDDYSSCHHLEEVSPPASDEGQFFYIPHHGILRPDSVSTPLRVVFDASAKDARGLSLNSTLLPGRKMQTNIFEVLVRFRWHPIVFTGDVRQMYRQILVPNEDADYQRIVWRPEPAGPVRDYRLRTVTYGVSCAPYQALRTISQLADDYAADFPAAAEVLRRDVYVDDVVTGAGSVREAISLRSELSKLFLLGGFHLRKWTSNSEDFFAGLPSTDLYSKDFRSFEDISDMSLKILGLSWLPGSDCFRFQPSEMSENKRCTKRIILSDIARIFDPLGLIAPVSFFAKYLMQCLWVSGVAWDEDVPPALASVWLRFRTQLSSLASLAIPRWMVRSTPSLQLLGFCDASERGYCAVIYCRTVDEQGRFVVRLCCAKTKVAPLKKLSVPRLELAAASLLADSMASVKYALQVFVDNCEIFAWSDSSVALTWIKSCPSRWKTFVANRVSRIQESIPPVCWRHIRTSENPADCGSRGLLPEELPGQSLWWCGPAWLSESEDKWPVPQFSTDKSAQDEARLSTFVASVDGHIVDHLFVKFSSLAKIKRVIAYIFRFVYNSRTRNKKDRRSGGLQPSELNEAFMLMVKQAQWTAFRDELAHLKSGSLNSLPKSLRKLSPFIDKAGLLRVGGRLTHSDLAFGSKYPLLLPRDHIVTRLIIGEYHNRFSHPGVQTLQNLIAQDFWVLSSRRAVRTVVSKCLKCFRANPRPAPAPIMGSLPPYRVSQIKPFSTVAVDYGGPFDVALGRGRGLKTYKSYICVFVCTSTKAVHIELASELSTEAFLAALDRFVARRGRCSNVISDQGRNFVGASNYFNSIMEKAALGREIKFSFNPPGSPHFNGLAEAGIKSVKTHLNRVIGTQRLTFEEFYTVLTRVESILNSRPLTPFSSDVNDVSALTPGHFLTLEPLSIVPEEDYSNHKISPLQRWKLVKKIHQDFWYRWSKEYLHTLQQRAKWNQDQSNIEIGTLVLIINEQTSPLKWSMGRVVNVHPGTDGVCRVVSVRTAAGLYKRPVVKLCPLPCQS